MQDVSKKLRVRVLGASQVKQSAGGVSIKAGVRAGLLIASPVLAVGSTALTPSLDTSVQPVDPSAGKNAKM